MNHRLSFRPIHEEDLAFLARLYATTRAEEMAMVPWTEEQKASFLQMQFDAQHTHYQNHCPDAEFSMVLMDGEPIGRLYLDRREDEHRVVDIALLPEHRGQGLGRALMEDVLAEARAAQKVVRIHVERNNPALRLYDRLGFKEIGDTGVYLLMEAS
jgi:ribosomal protein S18 acetylase RimI-like enzyme